MGQQSTAMRQILETGLPQMGLDIACIPNLEKFSTLLLEKNQVMNLTAITEPQQVATLHLLDSLALLGITNFSGKSVVDVGTGGGFPGIPLKIAGPSFSLTLLDSLQKRVAFLEEATEALGLQDVACVHGRAEEFAADHRESFHIAVSRAVANLSVLAELCLPLVAVGGLFLSMKSTDCQEELEQAKKGISLLGGTVRQVVDYTIPTTDISHRVIVIEKTAATPKKYPRRFAQIKKQPL